MKRMDTVLLDMMTVNENFRVLETGYDNIDSATGYLRRGCLSLLCARPGMGKSALAAQFAAHTADNGGRVAVFSNYHSAIESARKIMNAKPTFRSSQNIFLEDKIANERELRIAIGEMEQKPELLIIDCLQGMYRVSKSGHVVYDAPYICSLLKDLARCYDIAVLLISNLTRVPEYRKFHIPVPTDIPQWEKIKEYADMVGILHRRGYYECDSSDIQGAELFIRPSIDFCATVSLLWDRAKARFLTQPEAAELQITSV